MKENRAFRSLFITKKQRGFAWNFLETPIQNVQRCLSLLFQSALFLVFPLFQKYLKSLVRTSKMVNSVVYQPCITGIFHHMLEIFKYFEFMVFTFLENTLNPGIFTHAPVIHLRIQEEFFENLFPSAAERGWRELWFALIKFNQKWNIRLNVFYIICNFIWF